MTVSATSITPKSVTECWPTLHIPSYLLGFVKGYENNSGHFSSFGAFFLTDVGFFPIFAMLFIVFALNLKIKRSCRAPGQGAPGAAQCATGINVAGAVGGSDEAAAASGPRGNLCRRPCGDGRDEAEAMRGERLTPDPMGTWVKKWIGCNQQ